MATDRNDPEPHGGRVVGSVDKRDDGETTALPTATGARPDLDPAEPDSPTDLSKPSLIAVVKRAAKQFQHDNLTDLAAALTYYAVLAIVPGLIVLFALLGLLGPSAADELANQAEQLAPGSSADVVHTLITQAQENQRSAGLGAIIGLAVALWSASGYVAAFMRASNVVYGIGEGRPIWKTAPIRLGVTFVAVILLVVSAVIVVASGPVAQQIGDFLGVGDTTLMIWSIAKWPVLFVLVSVLLAILFWAGPNARQGGVKWISPGGVIAVLIWVIISALFTVYIANFSSYDQTYGSLAGIVIFLVWLWLTNIALLLGAEINAELDHAKAIAGGLPEDVEPFAEPRDMRKLDESDREAVRTARSLRRD
ncbi:YihY/virulence factor BrkB family protein [Nocardia shimofusensis]|uniref:YihY/virulence factor BrkB family protein n=1 Tax=Nocardia shimofusensis TaxID=228596 RepID=UPI000B138FB5|nr:YihY/virulence factor BrkB family protein [Nocardia shimofusensis]